MLLDSLKGILRVKFFEAWRQRAGQLKQEVYALWLAYRDPRLPWYAKLFAACVAVYTVSPIDLIPDPIPVIGYLDDVLLILLALKMIPDDVLADCRKKAQMMMAQDKPTN